MHQSRYIGRGGFDYPFAFETEPGDGNGAPGDGAPVEGGGSDSDADALSSPTTASPGGGEPGAGYDEPGEPAYGPDVYAPQPSPYRTADGYVLHLPRRFVARPRWWRGRYRWGSPRPTPGAAIRRIAQLARRARRIGTLRHRPTGRRLPVFRSAVGRRSYRIVARPRGQRLEIQIVRPSAPMGGEGETRGWLDQEVGSSPSRGSGKSPPPILQSYLKRVRAYPQEKQPLLLTISFHPRPLESNLGITVGGMKRVPIREVVRRHTTAQYTGFDFLTDLRKIRDDFRDRLKDAMELAAKSFKPESDAVHHFS